MHDEDIGKICSVCRKRDYIPYKCNKCKKQVRRGQWKYCDEHYWTKQVHFCLTEGERAQKGQARVDKEQYFCCQCKCRLYTVNHYYCPDCQSLYCLKHRHRDQHRCKERRSDSCQLV